MSEKSSVISQKRYLSLATLFACGLVSSDFQQQLIKYIPQQITRPFTHFKYVTGETPFSEWYWPVSFCFAYLFSIFALKAFMKNRTAPYSLFTLRIVHNFFLSFGSLVMLLGFAKETYVVYQKGGVEALFCDADHKQNYQSNLFFWYYVFFLSKFYEFIDTFILILRKKQTTFLHCFHHFITAILCWVGLYTESSIQWIVTGLNAAIHVFMYYYYLAQTLDEDVWWKKYLTTAQIIQFVIDITGISVWWYWYLVKGANCTGNPPTMFLTYCVLGSFLILFINFYIQTFKRGRREAARAKKE